jgi:hypothetical protein
MNILGLMISAGNAVFLRSTKHPAENEGRDFSQMEGPCHP